MLGAIGILWNLNDSGWGRSGGGSNSNNGGSSNHEGGARPEDNESVRPHDSASPQGTRRPRGQDGPPDLDELWRDFNQKLNNMFGKKNGGGSNGGNGRGPNSLQPNMKGAGVGIGLIAGLVFLLWVGSGFYIVQEGQQAVVTQFGKFKQVTNAGFNWRLPYPIEAHEVVNLTQLRSVEIGRNVVAQATGLKDSSMLTQDENILDVRFTIQYRLKNAAQFVFENRDPDEAVVKAAESAIREVVGRGTMDTVLNKDRDSIQRDVVKSVQAQMDRYKTGIQIQNANIQNVQPPEQVQAAFDDALKAGQDRDRSKNEGQAYANEVIPKAKGTAARLLQEAEGYKAAVTARAEGDAERFSVVYAEYAKAPAVTRDRMYLDTMTEIYRNVSKVMVDSRSGSNLLYLPLDKLLQQGSANTAPIQPNVTPPSSESAASVTPNNLDARSRDSQRTRERDSR